MSQSVIRMLMLGLLALPFIAMSSQGDWLACTVGVNCVGTLNANNLILGTSDDDSIFGGNEDDVIFGGDGNDFLQGDNSIQVGGNDLIFGGPGSDTIFPGHSDDIVLPGPDVPTDNQLVEVWPGDDKVYTFVGETTRCLIILDDGGYDEVYLIGFGPYIVEHPFGQANLNPSQFIILTDPVGGGTIFIEVHPGADGIEKIFGMPTPDVALVNINDINCSP